MDNKEQIQEITENLLNASFEKMKLQISRAIKSGALDFDNWDINNNSMLLPKIIMIAILEEEAEQYSANSTKFEKYVNKEVKNLKLFL